MNDTTRKNGADLVDGKYGIADLADLERLRGIFEKFTRATGFTIGFLDHPALNILAAIGWRDICTKFHRGCPASAEICTRSNRHLLDGLNVPGQVVIEACENGLVDCAMPVIIKGKHIASLATGQLLLEPPDIERFKRQAKLYGYDERAYLAALAEIPVVSRETLQNVTLFLGEIAFIISEMGYTNLVLKEESRKLEDEIAERKLAQLEKERLNAELTGKNEEMENFLYITNHDLRSPLVNIQGFSSNLTRYFKELEKILEAAPLQRETREAVARLTADRIPTALDFVVNSSSRMDARITTLLKVSRAGRVEMEPVTADMNSLVEKVVNSISYQLEEAGGKVTVQPLPACRADLGALDQIFTNLLDNAIKYRASRPLKITVTGKVKGGMAVYAVSDNGAGIPEPQLRNIWRAFSYVVKAPDSKGEGIGLCMAKRMAEKNAGNIRAESKEGEGSVFYVEMPAAEAKYGT